jgi:hypothetical protein
MFTADSFSSKKGKWQKVAKIIMAVVMAISLVFWTIGPMFF